MTNTYMAKGPNSDPNLKRNIASKSSGVVTPSETTNKDSLFIAAQTRLLHQRKKSI